MDGLFSIYFYLIKNGMKYSIYTFIVVNNILIFMFMMEKLKKKNYLVKQELEL